ncbi:UvrABC system protein C [Bacteroidia bacterium]|nr:UvrABC system protein C [Bacteroidia bacterium]
MNDDAKRQAATLPSLPGVYKYYNRAGEILYVGKAKSLKKRVMSYFVDSASHSAKTKVLVRQIARIDHIVVESESDALLLENNLIKTLQPRYNAMLKDDKTYPWIVIRNEPFPRIESTRRLVRDGSQYFGPYGSVSMQKQLLELIHAIYQLRTCKLDLSQEKIARGRYDVCLQYHIGNCKGPCKGLQSELEYDATARMIGQILRGDLRDTRRYLQRGMEQAASTMHYEQAAAYKARLGRLEDYRSRSVIVSNTARTIDVFSLLTDNDVAYCNFVHVVQGAVINSFTFELSTGVEQEPSDLLTIAIQQIYLRIGEPAAAEIVAPVLPHTQLFPGVKFTVPQKGDKLKLLEFSMRGARLHRLEKLKNLEIKDPARHTDRIMEAMQRALRLEVEPRHIECFDNSNLQGTNPVAACVVFRDGKPSRREYRHFNIKTVVGPDDFASMREVIFRRYRRMIDEGAELPQLIVVDGGKGQLSSACGVLRELGIDRMVAIVGLAKRIEEVFYPGDPLPYYLERGSEPLKVIMHIRDEAHRFGITFHRQKRSAAFIRSELEGIAGIGRESATRLLSRFGTMSALRKASPEELAAVVGASRATLLTAHFAKESK